MPSSTDGDDMPFYHPQWNEHDKPTVRCPHVEGRRIGDDYCQHVCPHLTRVIDRQYETIIDCGYTVRRSHTLDTGGCRFQTTIATPAESAPAPREQAAEAEAKELQTLFDIQHTRTVAADDAWRNAHPERGSVIPDLGELINWLQARAEKAEAEVRALWILVNAISVSEFSGTSANDVWVDGRRVNWHDRRDELRAALDGSAKEE